MCLNLINIDGLDEIKPNDAKVTLNFILELAKEEIPVVLTCRNIDWVREEKIIEMHSDMSDICFEHSTGDSYDIKGVPCLPSLNLGTFSNEELNKAMERHQFPGEVIKSNQLCIMAKHPVLLRLFSEYCKRYGDLSDPSNPKEYLRTNF